LCWIGIDEKPSILALNSVCVFRPLGLFCKNSGL
jgi:hypothetical protein